MQILYKKLWDVTKDIFIEKSIILNVLIIKQQRIKKQHAGYLLKVYTV